MIFVYYSLCKNFQKSRHDTAWRLLEYAVLKNFGISIKELEIAEGDHGKPYFKDRPDISFNLSHSGKYVACAINMSGRPVGVDIEEIRPIPDRVKNRHLCGLCDEREAIRRWTRRESYGKFTGEGLKIQCPDRFVTNYARLPGDHILFSEYDLEKYIINVCSDASDFDLSFLEIKEEDLPMPIFQKQ